MGTGAISGAIFAELIGLSAVPGSGSGVVAAGAGDSATVGVGDGSPPVSTARREPESGVIAGRASRAGSEGDIVIAEGIAAAGVVEASGSASGETVAEVIGLVSGGLARGVVVSGPLPAAAGSAATGGSETGAVAEGVESAAGGSTAFGSSVTSGRMSTGASFATGSAAGSDGGAARDEGSSEPESGVLASGVLGPGAGSGGDSAASAGGSSLTRASGGPPLELGSADERPSRVGGSAAEAASRDAPHANIVNSARRRTPMRTTALLVLVRRRVSPEGGGVKSVEIIMGLLC
ncbi:MAG TPA: hypothetical protein VM942_05060 [Acidimicrobiales bacterium]|nr:hypothetical protein [Acidimicrobiales bacterium]